MNPPLSDRSRCLCRAVWPVALMATVLWGSGTQGAAGPGWISFPHFDKLAHFFVFGLVATLVYRSLPLWPDRRLTVSLAIVITSLFGAGDEFRQSLNPDRYVELADWMADTGGAIVAVAAYVRWPFYRNLLEYSLNPFKRIRHGGRYRSQPNPGIAPDHRPAR